MCYAHTQPGAARTGREAPAPGRATAGMEGSPFSPASYFIFHYVRGRRAARGCGLCHSGPTPEPFQRRDSPNTGAPQRRRRARRAELPGRGRCWAHPQPGRDAPPPRSPPSEGSAVRGGVCEGLPRGAGGWQGPQAAREAGGGAPEVRVRGPAAGSARIIRSLPVGFFISLVPRWGVWKTDKVVNRTDPRDCAARGVWSPVVPARLCSSGSPALSGPAAGESVCDGEQRPVLAAPAAPAPRQECHPSPPLPVTGNPPARTRCRGAQFCHNPEPLTFFFDLVL